jgi:hypothetical protein
VDPDEPLLRFVDLTTVHLGRARAIEPAASLRPIVSTPGGDPLIAVGEDAGRRLGLIAFDLGESDLPLQIAFPLLMSNLVDYLLPAGDGILPSSMRLGQSLAVQVDDRIERVQVTTAMAAGGRATAEVPVLGGRLTLPGADAVGIRSLVAIGADVEVDGMELGQTAVNLFEADERDVSPGDPQRIVDMGRVPDTDERSAQPTRAEWWWPLVLVAVGLLAIEWLLFHRPTRRSLARALRRRPAPLGGPVR